MPAVKRKEKPKWMMRGATVTGDKGGVRVLMRSQWLPRTGKESYCSNQYKGMEEDKDKAKQPVSIQRFRK